MARAGEIEVGEALVRRLLAAQLPRWAELPLERVLPAGTDNAIWRLGSDLAVRLPRVPYASGQPEKEHRWLPQLAPRLPLPVPVPLALGAPGEGYPWRWTVCRWLDGETPVAEPAGAAEDLAALVGALQRIDPAGGPPPGGHNAWRGVPLAARDELTRGRIPLLDGSVDREAVTAAWDAALRAPGWHGRPVWIHGDLDARNLLVRGGRLGGVLDWGCLGVGDPACDVMVAWKLLSAETRESFRDALAVDGATWARARGWVVSQAVVALAYWTLETNATLVLEARRWLAEALAG